MSTPAGNEITVSVRIDGSAAMRDADKVEKGLSSKFKKFAIGLGAAATGAYALFYGGVTKEVGGAIFDYGNLLGRGTQFGQKMGQFASGLEAKSTAAERTVQTFGLAGGQASTEQILGVYNMHKSIADMEATSRNKILGVVGEAEGPEAVKMFKESVETFKSAAADFGDWLRAHHKGPGPFGLW